METKRFFFANFTLTSQWTGMKITTTRTVKVNSLSHNPRNRIDAYNLLLHSEGDEAIVYDVSYKFKGLPTTSKRDVTVQYSLPSGVKIKSAILWATISSPYTGCSILNVNGTGFLQKRGGESGAPVTLYSTSGGYRAVFTFRANGDPHDVNGRSVGINFSNVYLEIMYDGVTTASPTSPAAVPKPQTPSIPTPKPDPDSVFEVPPQSVCIYDETTGGVYLFDGVVKIQHTMSVKLEEEPDKKKEEYVNNARNEPDKVTLDVVMSDVYSSGGTKARESSLNAAQSRAFNAAQKALIDSRSSRSTLVYQVFHWLKEQRRRLTLITPQYIYVNMIITGMTVTQDDSCPFGWQGQITLQSAYQSSAQQQNKTGTGKPTEVQPPSEAMVAGFSGLFSGR